MYVLCITVYNVSKDNSAAILTVKQADYNTICNTWIFITALW